MLLKIKVAGVGGATLEIEARDNQMKLTPKRTVGIWSVGAARRCRLVSREQAFLRIKTPYKTGYRADLASAKQGE